MKFRNKSFEKALPIIAGFVLVLGTLLVYRNKKQVQEAVHLPYYSVSLDDVGDGCYEAQTYTSFMHLKLAVTVENHQLKKIEVIENKGSQGQRAEEIINEMIVQNKVAVPVVEKDKLGSIVVISCVDSALLNGLPEVERNALTGKSD